MAHPVEIKLWYSVTQSGTKIVRVFFNPEIIQVIAFPLCRQMPATHHRQQSQGESTVALYWQLLSSRMGLGKITFFPETAKLLPGVLRLCKYFDISWCTNRCEFASSAKRKHFKFYIIAYVMLVFFYLQYICFYVFISEMCSVHLYKHKAKIYKYEL